MTKFTARIVRRTLPGNAVGGFTLIETLISGVLLAVALTGVVGALRMSDVSTLQARSAARASEIARSRVEKLATMPYPTFVSKWGSGGTYLSSSGFSAFLLPGEAPQDSSTSGCEVLLTGGVPPGGTAPAELSRYSEKVVITAYSIPSGVLGSSAGSDYQIDYTMQWWVPGLVAGTYERKSFDVIFVKYCPWRR
jgi:Tfp pilus assembly protein PilV